ncbi:putative aspartate-semialdehyde dehydrogenase [Smittium mucronatum]|uniref:Putative aspartate-semialdehyde dehydrogenase n=1 Tax=Smittium mucronatum TaxID=133383 RepID=A0A1R0GX58_9FUNG|nr:putative aspartate-semialdehyde dehydrogenase [Smittium mucronatum]
MSNEKVIKVGILGATEPSANVSLCPYPSIYEKSFMKASFPLFTNSENYQLYDTVPPVTPTANPEFFSVIEQKRNARHPGLASIDILDSVDPLIGGEEEKIEKELAKILGAVSSDNLTIQSDSQIVVSAFCTRVPVIDGHTSSVSIEFAFDEKPSIDQIKACLSEYKTMAQQLGCHSAPEQAIIVFEEEDRPQPRLDRMKDNGMAVSIDRIRECPLLD